MDLLRRSLLAALVVGIAAASPAAAATLHVTSTADGPSTCLGPACTLRGAIAEARASAGNVGVVVLQGSIVDGPCSGTPGGVVDGGSTVTSDGSCNVTQPTSVANAEPGLAPLDDNGGATRTHAIAAGSPASGRATTCLRPDQRGAGRACA